MEDERSQVPLADRRQVDSARSSDLEALCNLASGVAHELRNPLNTVSLAIQLLQTVLEGKGIEVNLDLEAHFRKIHFELGKIRKILDNLTRFHPTTEFPLTRIDLRRVLERALAHAAGDLRRGSIEVRSSVPEGLVVLGDLDTLAEAILHILHNAVEAMPEGGVLQVVGESVGDLHCLRVSDTGCGIPEGSEARVFEPYFTTRPGRLGVGLTVASGIVRAHGGRLRVGRGSPVGTEVTIEIPGSEAPGRG